MKLKELFEDTASIDNIKAAVAVIRNFIAQETKIPTQLQAEINQNNLDNNQDADWETWDSSPFGLIGRFVQHGGNIKFNVFQNFALKLDLYIKDNQYTSKELIDDFILKLNNEVESIDWEIANYNQSLLGNKEIIVFILIPNTDTKSQITKLPKKLYHITTSDKVVSILKNGILPTTADNDAPVHDTGFGKFSARFKNKVFVFSKYNEDALYQAFDNLFKTGEMKIIEISTKDLPKTIKFFHDVTVFDEDDNKFFGYWTQSTLPSNALKLID